MTYLTLKKASFYSTPFFLGVIAVLVILIFTSCSSNSTGNINSTINIDVNTGWNEDALQGTEIIVIEQDGSVLLMGTESGLYLRTGQGIKKLGLPEKEIRGVVRLLDQSLVAGAIDVSDYSLGDVTLFRSGNQGKNWESYLNNYAGDDGKYTEFLSGPTAANSPADTIFINNYGSIVHSVDGGKNWKLINGQWKSSGTGLPILFYVDPFYPKRIWAGGVSGISQAYLFKAENYKDNNWINVSDGLSDNAEAIAYDVMTHPENRDWVLVGLTGAFEKGNNVRKSTDGGQTWQIALEKTGILAFARSKRNPNVIYASGRDVSGKLFFVTTSDFGETWEKNIFEQSPAAITTNDLGVMTIEGEEVLIFGTDRGLYSYKFE